MRSDDLLLLSMLDTKPLEVLSGERLNFLAGALVEPVGIMDVSRMFLNSSKYRKEPSVLLVTVAPWRR